MMIHSNLGTEIQSISLVEARLTENRICSPSFSMHGNRHDCLVDCELEPWGYESCDWILLDVSTET